MSSEHLRLVQDRRERRQRIILGGEIIFNGGTMILDCLVRNVSDHGCHLVMSNTEGVPSRFTLRIKKDGGKPQ